MAHDSGSLSVGERLESIEEKLERVIKHANEHGKDIQSLLMHGSRTREELNAHEMHCELKTKEIWTELHRIEVAMETQKGEVKTAMEARKGEFNALAMKLTFIVSIATFIIGCAVQYLMKQL